MQQTGEFSICFRKESLENVINLFIFSAWQQARSTAAKQRLGINCHVQKRDIGRMVFGLEARLSFPLVVAKPKPG